MSYLTALCRDDPVLIVGIPSRVHVSTVLCETENSRHTSRFVTIILPSVLENIRTLAKSQAFYFAHRVKDHLNIHLYGTPGTA